MPSLVRRLSRPVEPVRMGVRMDIETSSMGFSGGAAWIACLAMVGAAVSMLATIIFMISAWRFMRAWEDIAASVRQYVHRGATCAVAPDASPGPE